MYATPKNPSQFQLAAITELQVRLNFFELLAISMSLTLFCKIENKIRQPIIIHNFFVMLVFKVFNIHETVL